MRINAVLLVWSIFLQAKVALCGKMMGFRQNAEALEKSKHLRVLILKFKADAFVDSNTTYAEVGGVKVVNPNGTCLSCDSQAVCSSPDEPEVKGDSVQKACRGERWSWKVSPSSKFDIMIQLPLSKLKERADFGVVVTSAVDSSGQNSAQQQARQVRNWVLTTVLGTQDTSTGTWLRSAWSKVAVNLNGDFRSVVTGTQGAVLTKDESFGKELFAEHCLRPENITNYLVTELSLMKGELDVPVKCKAAFKGKPKVTECEEDLTPYKLSGCAAEFCTSPPASPAYIVSENSLAKGDFMVEVACKKPYFGEPEATVCAGDGKPYELSGCELTTTTITTTTTTTSTTTLTTTSTSTSTTETSTTTTTSTSTTTETTTTTSTTETITTTTTTTSTSTSTTTATTTTTIVVCSETEDKAYKLTVTSLEVPTFAVAASCADGYEGDANVEACEKENEPFKLTGCKEIVCQTPSDTSGYVLTETSTAASDFKISAQCAPLFHGNATAVMCATSRETYELKGCLADECSSPDDSTGYALTEHNLTLKGFDVQANCADGYTGVAQVRKCTKDAEAYIVEGCESTTTSTTTTTETETSTTTTTVTETITVTTTTTETITTTTTSTETSTTTSSTITVTETSTTTTTITSTETSTTTLTSTETTTETSTSTSTSTSTTTTTSTTTITETTTSTTSTTSTSTVTSTSTTTTSTSTTTITETETSTTTSTTSTTQTSTSTMTTTSTLTTTTTTTSTSTLTTTSTTSTSTVTSTTTTSTTTATSTTTTSTTTSTTTTSTSTITSTTTTTTSTTTSTTATTTSTTTATTTTITTTETSTTTTSTSTVTSTTTTSTSTVTTTTSTSTTTIQAVCIAPDSTVGYLVSENNLFVDHFAVSVTCNKGYEGTPVATACSKHLGAFLLSGCTPALYCKAPVNTVGYLVTENKLDIANFDVAVSCTSGFAQDSTPKAVACSAHNQTYSLQGCSKQKHSAR
mmetsp:Transcript_71076/g.156849  ORF Transcript_71076/g.156849 Transcript_71076/m.156849 type:complete len:978 (-) Transcript_71076:199-3132(-)